MMTMMIMMKLYKFNKFSFVKISNQLDKQTRRLKLFEQNKIYVGLSILRKSGPFKGYVLCQK